MFLLWLSAWFAAPANSIDFTKVDQAVQGKYGQIGLTAARDWRKALDVFKGGSEMQRLKDINEFFNRRLGFDDDQHIWGVNDYWATPIEAMIKGRADCEDYAIAKYVSLKHLGVAPSKLRMTYVKARIGGPNSTLTQAHMVLAYYPSPDAEPMILDNLVSEIRPASRRADLAPIFSFNSEGLWKTGGGAETQESGGSRLTRWNDLLKKLQDEGID